MFLRVSNSRIIWQVYIFDVDEVEMKRVEKQFNEEFGDGTTTCVKCDVTSQEDFESNGKSFPFIISEQ